MDIQLGSALFYILYIALHREGFQAGNFTAQLSGQELCFSPRGHLLQPSRSGRLGTEATSTHVFGERVMCRQQQEEVEEKAPSTFCMLISLHPWGLTVFYWRKAVWAFKAASLPKTSKQLYKAEGLMKGTAANLSLNSRITAGK